MALANISIATSTFFEWVVRTNQLVVIANRLTEGQANSTGTLTLTNAGGTGGGITLNVASGLIKGDGGLLSNVRTSSLSQNSITFISNSATLTISGGASANLGGVVYFDIGTLSTSTSDAAAGNIASAQSVNTVNQLTIAAYNAANTAVTDYSPAFDQANTAWDKANSANVIASAAFDKANTANVNAANASFMSTGTVASARISGDYTGITRVGGTLTGPMNVSGVIRSTSGGFRFPNGNTVTNWTVSTSAPSGGSDGDVWIQI